MHCDIIEAFNAKIIFLKTKVGVSELQLCNDFTWSKIVKQYQALSQSGSVKHCKYGLGEGKCVIIAGNYVDFLFFLLFYSLCYFVR